MNKGLQVWSPFHEMENWFDRDVFDRFFGGGRGREFNRSAMPLESFVENDKLVIRADMPGVDPEKVEVSLEGNTLTIRGKREERHDRNERGYLHREFRYGSYERAIELPAGIRADDLKASFTNGVLEVTMPLPQELVTRKVPVQIERSNGAKSEAAKTGEAQAAAK